MNTSQFDMKSLDSLWRSEEGSHKGENGKVLVIGGSRLFHASIFWSADVASRIVDMVYFSSPANENNELVRMKLKAGFWNGIVVDWNDINDYVEEADVVLIGPGMPRVDGMDEGDVMTSEVVNTLLGRYPDVRWVVDGGALQEVDHNLLNGNMIITPHQREWERLIKHSTVSTQSDDIQIKSVHEVTTRLSKFSRAHDGLTILYKGKEDFVCCGEECVVVSGGNPGMTKGGTGDVLAGLVAGLYAKNSSFLAAQVGSYLNKTAGDRLQSQVGIFYNSSDLVGEVGAIWRGLVG